MVDPLPTPLLWKNLKLGSIVEPLSTLPLRLENIHSLTLVADIDLNVTSFPERGGVQGVQSVFSIPFPPLSLWLTRSDHRSAEEHKTYPSVILVGTHLLRCGQNSGDRQTTVGQSVHQRRLRVSQQWFHESDVKVVPLSDEPGLLVSTSGRLFAVNTGGTQVLRRLRRARPTDT